MNKLRILGYGALSFILGNIFLLIMMIFFGDNGSNGPVNATIFNGAMIGIVFCILLLCSVVITCTIVIVDTIKKYKSSI